ncbi:MAG: hypothetical protein LBF85_10260 [Tannerella sp.]|jgi:uncharacterized membrane protein YcjF (UPF0283 family)|nr:hypothetical protein [Tannerella sp.]
MKDILFTAKQQKREIAWLCACIAASFILNAISIIVYRTEWKELWTQSVWVIFIGAGLYALSVFIRLIACGVIRLFRKRTD